jgi:hypothetical protein
VWINKEEEPIVTEVPTGFDFRPLRKEDFVTRTTAVDPLNIATPLWDHFLQRRA